MIKKFVWNKGKEKGQTICETSYLPDYNVLRIPLPIVSYQYAKVRMIGDSSFEEPHTPIPIAICTKSNIVADGKMIYLCELE